MSTAAAAASASVSAATPDLDVMCLGEVIVDFFPETPGRALVDVDRYVRHQGGALANVAVAAAHLGARVGLCAVVGHDDFGTFLRQRLIAAGVDVAAVTTHPSRTGVTFVAIAADGARSFVFHREGAADQHFGPEHVDPAQILRGRVLQVGSSTLARPTGAAASRKAIAAARAAGRIVSFDPNWRGHLWRDPAEGRAVVHELCAAAEIVKISDDELGPLLGDADLARGGAALRAAGAGLVVITQGAGGCTFFAAGGGEGHLPAVPTRVVDTTGAGDAFVAGLLTSLAPALRAGVRPAALGRDTVIAACQAGHATASRVVAGVGATAPLFAAATGAHFG